MFGLIPMVITIILAGLITAAVAYLGGDIFTESSISAKANTFVNEGSQLRSAAQLFRVNEAAWPAAISDLTNTIPGPSYMSSEPSNTYTFDATGIVSATSTDNTDDLTADICNKIQDAAVGNETPVTGSAPIAGQLFGCYDNGGVFTFFHK